jgi:hypothetical protein
MKYISSVLTILVLLHAGVSEGATDNWVFVTRYISSAGYREYDNDTYISKDRIKTLPNGNRVVRVLSTNFASGSLVASDYYDLSSLQKITFVYRSDVIVEEYDCMSEMYRIVSNFLYYSGPMASGKVWTETNRNSLEDISQDLKRLKRRWNPVPRGSIYEKIMDSVCN